VRQKGGGYKQSPKGFVSAVLGGFLRRVVIKLRQKGCITKHIP